MTYWAEMTLREHLAIVVETAAVSMQTNPDFILAEIG
jgi:hypothetical protein